jgi:hypothetical protein
VESWERYCRPVVTFPAVISLDTILSLCGRGRLPLHVRGTVGSASLKRLNMIDYITLTWTRSLTAGWARVGFHEIMLSLRASLNSSPTVARAGVAITL